MINLSRKLYISLFTLILLILTTGTVTFAWLKTNQNAWFDDLELDLDVTEGFRISVDGSNWKNNLTTKDIKMATVAKSKGYKLVDIDGDIYYEDDKGNTYSTASYESDYDRLSLKPVTTTDGHSFTNLYGRSIDISEMYYVSLDLYLCSVAKEACVMYLSDTEQVINQGTKDEYTIPKTSITTINADSYGWPDKIFGNFNTYDKTTGEIIKYSNSKKNVIDGFKTLASDAARISISSTTYPTYRLYEINEGNGSYVTRDMVSDTYKGAIGAAYDKEKSAAYTYYNNVVSYEGTMFDALNNITDDDLMLYKDLPNTYTGFDSVEAASIGNLNADNNYGVNGELKVTINFWIEGWDADCMDTVFDQRVSLFMAFTGYRLTEDPIEVTFNTTNPNTGDIIDTYTLHQFQGQKMSYNKPRIDSTGNYKFVGWGIKDETSGEVTAFDYDTYLVNTTGESNPKLSLVSMWEQK